MSKETTKENHYHNINGLKGRDIQAKMVELVDGDNWTEKDIHHFYCSSGSSQPQGGQVPKAAVKMQPAPTTNQPGNALVKIRNKAAKWSDLEPVVKNEKFPESRERYLDTPIDKNSFERESVKAHVLLDYEVARRKPMTSSDGFYPLTRSQVEEGISAAISHPDQDYSEKVVFEIQLVCFKSI